MAIKHVKEELEKVFGVVPKAKESTDRYAGRVAAAIAKVPDQKLAGLSQETKAWLSSTLNLEIPGSDTQEPEKGKDEESGQGKGSTGTVVGTLAITSKGVELIKPAQGTSATPKGSETSKPKGKRDLTASIKKVVYAHQTATPDDLIKILADKGIAVKRSTLQTIRADFLHTMRVLGELGALAK